MSVQPIATPSDLATYLTGDQNQRLDQFTASVRSYCGWHVAPVETQEATVRGDGSCVLFLKSLKVAEVASVTLDGEPVTGWTLHQEGYLTGRRWACDKEYVVTFTHGYTLAEAADLQGVILAAAAGSIRFPDGRLPTNLSLGQARIGYSGDGGAPSRDILPAAQMAVLDKYRLHPRP